mmetsp:Transcript_16600/g.36164  ORF Transcript_16600/g.36164 Transcript_16600/m.36164 type:complete len:231 (+) Transcript_16600:140-832(+)
MNACVAVRCASWINRCNKQTKQQGCIVLHCMVWYGIALYCLLFRASSGPVPSRQNNTIRTVCSRITQGPLRPKKGPLPNNNNSYDCTRRDRMHPRRSQRWQQRRRRRPPRPAPRPLFRTKRRRPFQRQIRTREPSWIRPTRKSFRWWSIEEPGRLSPTASTAFGSAHRRSWDSHWQWQETEPNRRCRCRCRFPRRRHHPTHRHRHRHRRRHRRRRSPSFPQRQRRPRSLP